MIASTCLAVLFVPSFFVVLQRFEEWRKRRSVEARAGGRAASRGGALVARVRTGPREIIISRLLLVVARLRPHALARDDVAAFQPAMRGRCRRSGASRTGSYSGVTRLAADRAGRRFFGGLRRVGRLLSFAVMRLVRGPLPARQDSPRRRAAPRSRPAAGRRRWCRSRRAASRRRRRGPGSRSRRPCRAIRRWRDRRRFRSRDRRLNRTRVSTSRVALRPARR